LKRRVTRLIVGLALVALFGNVGAVYAQEISTANIPFSFTVDNKVMPAGKYEVSVSDPSLLTLTPAKGPAIVIPVITRLAAQGGAESKVVFDKVDNTYYLSEVWFPPRDGFMVRSTKEPHTHNVVKGEKKRT
jgi:hypothetical protein